MRWKVVLDYLEDKYREEGCNSSREELNRRLAEVISEREMLEGVKVILSEFGGHCTCEVFFNAVWHLDRRLSIPTIPDRTMRRLENRRERLLDGKDHDNWARRVNLTKRQSAKYKEIFLDSCNKAIEVGGRD